MAQPRPTLSPRDLLVSAADRARMPEKVFHHAVNPSSEIHFVDLGRKTGLKRVGVTRSRVPPGKDSYAFHVHQGEEECLFVLCGRGAVEIGPERIEIGPGDFVGFPPRTHPHLVRNPGPDDLVYLDMGEAFVNEVAEFPRDGRQLVRRKGETRIYPLDAGQLVAWTQKAPPPLPPPGSLRVAGADRTGESTFHHALNPRSEIHGLLLSRRIGLERLGVSLARLAPGKESFIFHVHRSEEEFAYVLSGRGTADVGDARFEVGPGDFLGFPPSTHAHLMRNTGGEDLFYISGGENREIEVADFPREGKRLVRIGGEISIHTLPGDPL